MSIPTFKIGDKVICVFAGLLPTRTKGPKLTEGNAYEVKNIHTENGGFQHLDVGIKSDLEYITSQDTGRELPDTGAHWCHPSRFKKTN